MIDRLIGAIKSIKETSLVIATPYAWFDVYVPTPTAWQQNDLAEVFVYMHWSQENGPTLYGFTTDAEKQFFILITSCSGVGPKLGLAILSELGINLCLEAISQQNDATLSKVSGIGPRKAEQIIVQLRHKIAAFDHLRGIDNNNSTDWQLVLKTLESLHYSRIEIARALAHLRKEHTTESISFDQLVKSALSYLSRPSW